MKALVPILSAWLLSAGLAPAQAKVLNHASHPFNFSFTTATAAVPIGGTPASPLTELSVTAPSAGRYVLAFSAECAAMAPSAGFVDVDLLVNGVAVSPSAGSGNAFCMARSALAFTGFERSTMTVAVKLVAGHNTISVRGRLWNGSTAGWLSDAAIVVHG